MQYRQIINGTSILIVQQEITLATSKHSEQY